MTPERPVGLAREFETNPYPGLFVCLEGGDACGKSRQLPLVAGALRKMGLEVEETYEPSDGQIGRLIRQALGDGSIDNSTLQALFVADRLDHLRRQIVPWLEKGVSVVSDRYWWSTQVYADPQDKPYAMALHSHPRIILPDLTVILELPLDVVASRMGVRGSREIFDYEEKQGAVQIGYRVLANRFHESTAVLDARGSPEEVTEKIIGRLVKIPKLQALIRAQSPICLAPRP